MAHRSWNNFRLSAFSPRRKSGEFGGGGAHAILAADQAVLFDAAQRSDIRGSVILAVLAVLAAYGKMSIFNASYAFLVLLVAYLVLLVGVMFRGV
jgi:asparagine N-glycosylation enzyme membrane subunit Stt3